MPAQKTPRHVLEQAVELVNQHDGDISAAARMAGLPRGTLNNRYQQAMIRLSSASAEKLAHDPMRKLDAMAAAIKQQIAEPVKALIDFGARRFVVTSAQNATPVDVNYWDALKNFCRHTGSQLIVIPYRYKNPTSTWTADQEEDDWWAPEVQPYLLTNRTDLNDSLVILADIKTQPTASRPLSGFQTFSGGKSAIIGHPKLELETVPTPQHKLPKILTTTGACTVANYSDSKAGKVGTHHHTLGAAVVELDGDAFHLRQINATHDGCFYDLTTYYMPHGVRTGVSVAALIMGDSHIEVIDPNVVEATFIGDDSICQTLRPEYLVWHDVIDQYARNHHHKGDPFIAYAKHNSGIKNNVEQDLRFAFEVIDQLTPDFSKNIFVPSNHVDALKKWVKDTAADPTRDPENLVFWAKTFVKMLEATTMGATGASTPDPFVMWAKEWLQCADRSLFLKRDEPCQIKGIELGYHGDAGPNGARGSRNAFGRIGVKTVIGHSHSPGIRDGVYQVGTSSMYDLEYASGPSSWLHTHCVIYPNGKRALINIIGQKWRLA